MIGQQLQLNWMPVKKIDMCESRIAYRAEGTSILQPRGSFKLSTLGIILSEKNKDKMASKPIVLMIWIHDIPITGSTISMSNITEPRKAFSEYSVGEKVKARLNRFGIVEGVIGKIGDDNQKREFNDFINSRCFDQLVSDLGCCGEDSTKQSEDHTSKDSTIQQKDKQEVQKPTARKSAKNKGGDSEINASSGKKMKLDLERAAASLELTELSESIESSSSCSSVYAEVAQVLLNPGLESLSSTQDTETQDTERPQSSEQRIESRMEQSILQLQQTCQSINCQLFQLNSRMTSLESNVQWLWQNMRNGYYKENNQTVNRPAGEKESSSEGKDCTSLGQGCSEKIQNNKRLSTSDLQSSCSPVQGSSTSSLCEDNTEGICSEVFNNYTKDQLRSFVEESATFVKASKCLFRKLYTEEERTGRSLTGSAANKSLPPRPALQDQKKLRVLYELVQEKYPWCTRALINSCLADLLKPSVSK